MITDNRLKAIIDKVYPHVGILCPKTAEINIANRKRMLAKMKEILSSMPVPEQLNQVGSWEAGEGLYQFIDPRQEENKVVK